MLVQCIILIIKNVASNLPLIGKLGQIHGSKNANQTNQGPVLSNLHL